MTSLVQSAITCTQEWNVVQYLVNKTNMDSLQNESLSSIMKIALHSTQYTVTHLFWSISPNSHCTSVWNKLNCITKPQQRISSVRVLDCRAGGRRFDSWDQTNTQGLNMTEKWTYCLCPANSTGKNNGFPFLDILGYLKNTHKNPKFGRVRQVPIRELGWEFPGYFSCVASRGSDDHVKWRPVSSRRHKNGVPN